jgi:hypothetical protein
MFRFPIWISSLGTLIVGILWISYLCHFKGESLSEKKRTQLKQSLESSAIATSVQNRTYVRKDIWITEPTLQRLQTRIDSQTSVLTAEPKAHCLEIIENLYDIQCWSQEKLYNNHKQPTYQMRMLQAKKGLYKYQTKSFEATDATLALYKIPGISLITNLLHHKTFLQGTAKEISFTVKEGTPYFEAREFNASLTSGEK